jgi:D-alanyl-D-alanine carboxypeptidase/D-alanyl-D-alanine-endopeptidase (penicillin-binding protein 4)
MKVKNRLTQGCCFLFIIFLTFCQDSRSRQQAEEQAAAEEQQNPLYFLDMEPLLSELGRFRSQKCIDSVTLAYLVIDVTGPQPHRLVEYQADRLLIPASVQKLLVTGAALEILGQSVIKEVTVTNLHSNNWMANKLLRRIGEAVNKDRSFVSGCEAVKKFWQGKGIDMTGSNLVDGSGRRYDNTLTARQIAGVLQYQRTAATFGSFYSSLPLAGISGTMRKTLDGTVGQGKIRAKTGTLAAVKSLAGYATTHSGRKLIFVIIVNNYTCRTSFLQRRLEDILIRMVEL